MSFFFIVSSTPLISFTSPAASLIIFTLRRLCSTDFVKLRLTIQSSSHRKRSNSPRSFGLWEAAAEMVSGKKRAVLCNLTPPSSDQAKAKRSNDETSITPFCFYEPNGKLWSCCPHSELTLSENIQRSARPWSDPVFLNHLCRRFRPIDKKSI